MSVTNPLFSKNFCKTRIVEPKVIHNCPNLISSLQKVLVGVHDYLRHIFLYMPDAVPAAQLTRSLKLCSVTSLYSM